MNPLIEKARAFALKAHNVQTYGDIYPYYKHCENVYEVLLTYGFNEDTDIDILVAAWLHDTIEDTNTSYNDIKKEFGIDVAEIVYCVTDELGRNRKEKKEKTLPKIRSNPKAVILKVADRLANVKFSAEQKSDHFKMYQNEYPDFQYNLRIYKQIDNMWVDLENMLFGGN
jgi:(p)ppGpp synthase/HD superfamily hydrolase